MYRNGLARNEVDENGIQTDNIYDGYGRLETVVQNTTASQIYGVTGYTYDTMGNLIKVVDGATDAPGNTGEADKIAAARLTGNATVMVHDILGRKTAMVEPDTGLWA
jgi:hypothetical protein